MLSMLAPSRLSVSEVDKHPGRERVGSSSMTMNESKLTHAFRAHPPFESLALALSLMGKVGKQFSPFPQYPIMDAVTHMC